MTSADFSNLLRQFPDLDATACAGIAEQIKKTNYCQALYVLQARAKKNSGDPDTSRFIQQAAVYASDRAHLKKLLEQSSKPTPQAVNASALKESEQEDLNQQSIDTTPEIISTSTLAKQPDHEYPKQEEEPFNPQRFSDIAEELMTDLQILKEKTEAFQHLNTVRPKLIVRSTPAEPNKVISEQRILDTAPPAPKVPRAMDETDLLISEIKSTRKKIKADGGKLAEQLDIIDQFIKSNQVTIRPPEKGTKKQDLAETAGNYSENVISETLVEILVRQGKKDKAIDVLRKLIWKFPQKKHLFAARIQELSN